jgi:hypothetical protein
MRLKLLLETREPITLPWDLSYRPDEGNIRDPESSRPRLQPLAP